MERIFLIWYKFPISCFSRESTCSTIISTSFITNSSILDTFFYGRVWAGSARFLGKTITIYIHFKKLNTATITAPLIWVLKSRFSFYRLGFGYKSDEMKMRKKIQFKIKKTYLIGKITLRSKFRLDNSNFITLTLQIS